MNPGMNASIRGAAGVGLLAMFVAGCGSSTADNVDRHTASAPAPTSAVADTPDTTAAETSDPMSEAALRETLDQQYAAVQRSDWHGMHSFYSPRCQLEWPRDRVVAAAESEYRDRDFSGPEQYLITMNGSVATVVVKSFDGKGKMQPMTWSFINGSWVYDAC